LLLRGGGSAQAGRRPAVVVSNDVNNEHSPVVTAAAITKTIPSRRYPHTVFLPVGVLPLPGTILGSQIFTFDKADLLRYRGELGPDVMNHLGRALAVALALPREK
jgi:mRNA interferase MazF